MGFNVAGVEDKLLREPHWQPEVSQIMRIVRISLLFLSFSCFVSLLANSQAAKPATKPINFVNKIAFVKGGEIWIADQGGEGKTQVTTTSGKVEDFMFSADLNYLAYSKILKYVDEPGLFEEGEPVPKRAVCSIVVMDLRYQKVVREIEPQDNWIYLARWLPEGRLLCYESSGFDVAAFFEFDAINGTKKEVDPHKANQLWEADFSPDGSLMLYVDDSGLGASYHMNLHWVDLKSQDDKILLSHKTIYDPKLSNDKKNVAFIEVGGEKGESFDSLWAYNILKGELKKYYTEPAKAKSAGERSVSWSPDSRYISTFLAPEALVFAVENSSIVHKIRGREFHWAGEKRILCASGADVYMYDLDTRTKQLLLKETSKPTFLSKQ